jgi:hypothetical protein
MVDVFDAALDAQDVAVVLLYQADGTLLAHLLDILTDYDCLVNRMDWPDITVSEST